MICGKSKKTGLLAGLLSLGLFFFAGQAGAAYDYNMPRGVTPISREIYDLHMIIFWICVAIGVVVFSFLFYSLIKYRKSKGAIAAQFHEHTWVEIIWAIIPFIILVVMAIPATKVLIAMEDTSDSDLSIKITGHQWKWQYEYLDEDINFFSNLSTPKAEINNQQQKNKWYLLQVDKPLVVPIHKKIRLLLTSNDVIHSWWVPELGVKKDAVPGFIQNVWMRIEQPGIYRGQCAELCGQGHGFMPIVVEAKTEEDYNKWLAAQKKGRAEATIQAARAAEKKYTKDELLKMGKQSYDMHCAVCHKADGSGMPPAFPALKNGPISTGAVKGHIEIVLHGKSGTAMQAFSAQLSDEDIAAIVTYEREAWGNKEINAKKNQPIVVQPKDVKELRG